MIVSPSDTTQTVLGKSQASNLMNAYGRHEQPFLFVIPFDSQRCIIYSSEELDRQDLKFDFNGNSNTVPKPINRPLVFHKHPLPYHQFLDSYGQVIKHINAGNSYLVNLTFQTEVETNYTLEEIFYASKARYKLYVENQFVTFSPEIFVKISDGIISSFPMKGTIDASIENAEQKLLENPKEIAEHATIVDLIRNDLSIVSDQVQVEQFRYIDRVSTHEKELLQVSSKISGKLPRDYKNRLGDIIFSLLPGGSISGAPKKMTLDIIESIEQHQRGFYTGICGYFDGNNLDSGMMIRFIEQQGKQLFFKSGGGITANSDPWTEYQEYIDKIYVPIN
jgi:para-aminobenzoate synthetase component 1